MSKPRVTDTSCVQCAHAGVVCRQRRRTKKCVRCIQYQHDCSFRHDLHARDVDIYLPEIIESVEEVLGGHDVSLTALTEAHEDLYKLVERVFQEIKSVRGEMKSGRMDRESLVDGVEEQPNPVSQSHFSPELGGETVQDDSKILSEVKEGNLDVGQSRGKARSARVTTVVQRAESEAIDSVDDHSRSSSPEVAREGSNRSASSESGDDDPDVHVNKIPRSQAVVSSKRRISRRADPESDMDHAGTPEASDNEEAEYMPSPSPPVNASKEATRPKPRPVRRKTSGSGEFRVASSDSITVRKTSKTSRGREVAAPKASSSKSVTKRGRSASPTTYRTTPEVNARDESDAGSPLKRKCHEMSEDRVNKFKKLKEFTDYQKKKELKKIKKEKA